VARVSRKEFDRLAEEALEKLPDEFKRFLTNVMVAVEEEPTDEDYEETATPDDEELLGIFRGAMSTERSFDDLPSLPPQVVVFRGPILRCTQTKGEIVKEIGDTVRHELGHLFGLEDEEMPY
jgi:predicted Zn-dependent protease with MMP-like domain